MIPNPYKPTFATHVVIHVYGNSVYMNGQIKVIEFQQAVCYNPSML